MTGSEISKLGGESEPLIVIADECNAEAHLAQEGPLARLARRGRGVADGGPVGSGAGDFRGDMRGIVLVLANRSAGVSVHVRGCASCGFRS